MKFLIIAQKIFYACLLAGAITTAQMNAMQQPQNKHSGFIQSFWSNTKSFFSSATDFIIQKALINPALIWFEGLPRSEQERIVLDSSDGSSAHELFKKMYGEYEYKKLVIYQKPTFVHVQEQRSPLASALLLWADVIHNPLLTSGKELVSEKNSHQTDSTGIQPHNGNTAHLCQSRSNYHFDITDKQVLDNRAITQGVGYKTANLDVLQQLCQSPELQNLPNGITVKVPEFVGVSDNHIKNFLKKNNLDISASWKKLIEEVSSDDIKNFVITPDFIQKLEQLADHIQDIFDSAANQVETEKITLKQLGFDQKLEDLIVLCVKLKAFITTRSTGREDTEELANAGGNASNEIVDASAANVLRGMGTVVSSYFRAKSIGQRALLQDTKLYDVPLMPVLIQRVVSEMDGSSFSGCVSYTREPQGNVPGISISQCTHGHTKGVVDSLVPLDTIICNKTRCHIAIKKKPTRLAPVSNKSKEFALNFVDNNQHRVSAPSLTPVQQKALAQVLEFIERVYGKAMDLELSFDLDNNILYIYQARPLVVKPSDQSPSYIIGDSQLGTALTCTTMSQAGGSLRLINDKNRIIVTPTLDDALNFYLAQRETNNDFDFDLVVVHKQADATSHAAATFNGMSKPVMVTDDYEQLQQWISQHNFQLLADVQKSKLYKIHDTQFKNKTLEQLKAHGLIKDGMCAYPIPHVLSIPEGTPLPTAITLYAELRDEAHEESLESLVEILKCASKDQATLALNTILSRLAKQITIKQQQISCPDNKFFDCIDYLDLNCPLSEIIDMVCFTQPPAQQALEQLNNLFALALELRTDIADQLSCQAYDLKRLFPVALLETLLFQKPNNEIVNSYSYSNVLENYHATISFIKNKVLPLIKNKTISANFLNNREFLALAESGARAAFTENIENKWIIFIAHAAQEFSSEQQETLRNMLTDIINLNMLPAWISTRFASQQGSLQEIVSTLSAEYLQDQFFLKQLKSYKEHLDQTDPTAWQEGSHFEQLRNAFETKIFNWATSLELEQIVKNPDQHPFAYQAAVSIMNTFVGTFDQIIKSIKSTPETKIDIQERAMNFKIMIGKYLELLERWSTFIPNNIIQYHEEWPLDKYLFELKRILNETIANNSELFPSPEFNVNGAALGSATNLKRSRITTLEDLFTTIHQSLLIITSSLETVISIDEKALPGEFRKNADLLTAWVDGETKSYKTGTTFENQVISYHYNIPLENHSMAVVLIYSKTTSRIDISFQFFGERIKRWQIMNIYAQLTAKIYKLSLKDIKLNENGISFTLSHNSLINPTIISQILIDTVSITYDLYDIAFSEIFNESTTALGLVEFIVISLQNEDSLTRSSGLLALDRLLHKVWEVDILVQNQITEKLHSAISFLLQHQDTPLYSSGVLALKACINNIERFGVSIQTRVAEKFSTLQNFLS